MRRDIVQPATELAVAGSVLHRLTCSGGADRRVLRPEYETCILNSRYLHFQRWFRGRSQCEN
jgi:hypothetical protein